MFIKLTKNRFSQNVTVLTTQEAVVQFSTTNSCLPVCLAVSSSGNLSIFSSGLHVLPYAFVCNCLCVCLPACMSLSAYTC